MITIFTVLIALVIAAVHLRSKKAAERSPTFVVDTFLVWWLVVAVGLTGVSGAAFHIFDGPATAELIGYARGEGGFQFENAMGDLAIGVVGIMCFWYRGTFWLAAIVFLSVQFLGDAAGHIYFWLAENNTKPGNIGPPLWSDIILPIVAWVLYAVSASRGGEAGRRPVAG